MIRTVERPVLRFVDKVILVFEVIVTHVLIRVESISTVYRLVPQSHPQLSRWEIPPGQMKSHIGSQLLESAPRGQTRDPQESIGVVEVSVRQGVCVVDRSIGRFLAEARRVMVHELYDVEGATS